MERPSPTAFALLVAVALLANPLYLYTHPGQAGYGHSIEPIDRSEVPDDSEVLQYGELSPEAQAAVDAALASPDGYATVHGEANRPPEFRYSDDGGWGRAIHAIEKGGELYRFDTYDADGLFPADLYAALALALTGIAVGAGGLAGWHDASDPRSVAVTGGVTLVASATATTGLGIGGGLLAAGIELAATTATLAATADPSLTVAAVGIGAVATLAVEGLQGYDPIGILGAAVLALATLGATVGYGGRRLRGPSTTGATRVTGIRRDGSTLRGSGQLTRGGR